MGTVVQRWLTGSTHCSSTSSTSEGVWARSVTSPSVSTGTSSGNRTGPVVGLVTGTPCRVTVVAANPYRCGHGRKPQTMSGTLANIGLIVVFILIGSMFAAAEIALVSLRDGQVRAMAGRGRRGEAVARLAADPNRFLAAVQVGVTLAGFLSASFGGATLSRELAPKLVDLGMPAGAADIVALVLVTIAISYVSLVLGELAP